MRILQVAPYFAPAYSYGGPPETVHRLCEALADRGHEITVLTTDAFSSTKRQPTQRKADGFDTYYLKNLSNFLAWNHQLFLPFGISTFLRDRVGKFDIIHMHSFRTLQNVVIRRYSISTGTPYVLSAHGSLPIIVRKRLAKNVFDAVIGHSVLRGASWVIAVSNAEKRQYEAMHVPSSKIAVIPNGIDSKQFAKLPSRGLFSRDYGLDGKLLVTYIGRLNSRKGLDTLLRSVRLICDRRDDVTLVLVGPDDGYRGHVERLIKRLSLRKNVLLTGLITLPRKLEVLVDSDVVVYPGSFEIFGLVPFEALSCGTPVIVADDSGCGEIIREAEAGITVPVGDVRSLSEAIGATLDGGIEVQGRTRRGRDFVQKSLTWGRIAMEVEEVYERTIADRRFHSTAQPPQTMSNRHHSA